MSDSRIDRLPVNQLPVRYSISKPALYARLNALEIQPLRFGRKSYVSAQQLQLLDSLDQYLKQKGATVEEFLEKIGRVRQEQSSEQLTEQSTEQLSQPSERESAQLAPARKQVTTPGLIEAIPALIEGFVPALADALASRLTPLVEGISAKLAPPPNPLAELEALERAYSKRWILSTSQLASVLKLSPRTIADAQTFERHGFIFTRAGKVGAEIGWRVGKDLTD